MTKLFLSYARGDDEPFVWRVYRDLVDRGFDVWFDRVRMPSRRLTFHQEIRDAVAASERLLLVVGLHAAASDYVRQEWSFAWFECHKIVTPILRGGDYSFVPHELRSLHCEDFRNAPDYDHHINQLVRILREPMPPLGRCTAVPLLPTHYLPRSEAITKLRDALRGCAEQALVISGAVAKIGLYGMGGIGKTVLAAALAHDRMVREAFPDGIVWIGLGTSSNLIAHLQNVLFALGGEGAITTEYEGREKLKALLKDKAVLLVIDDVWRRSELELFNVLSTKSRTLITTRDAGLLQSFGATHHVVELLTDAEALDLLVMTAGIEPNALPTEAYEVLDQCGRLPLAISLAGGMVRGGTPWLDLWDALRMHELEYVEDPHADSEHHVNLQRMLEVSLSALTDDAHQRFAELAVFPEDELVPEAAVTTLWQHTGKLSPRQTRKLLIDLKQRSMLQLEHCGESAKDIVGSLFIHDLVHDFCVRLFRQRFGDDGMLHGSLLDAYRQICLSGWWDGPRDGYFFGHLRNHLIKAGRIDEFVDLLQDLRWMEAKNDEGLAFDLPRDFSMAIGALSSLDERRRILILLNKALLRDIHFIHDHRKDYPQGMFQCLWNSGWWYDTADAAKHFKEPDEGWNRPPPWDQTGPKLSDLLMSWRASRKERKAKQCWIRSIRPPRIGLGTAQEAIIHGVLSWGNYVQDLALSPDGQVIAIAQSNNLAIVNAISGQCLHILERSAKHLATVSDPDWKGITWMHPNGTATVDFAPDGRNLVSGGVDWMVRIWDVNNGEERCLLSGHKESVTSVAYAPDGMRIVSGSEDGTVRVWDAVSGAVLCCFRGHRGKIGSVAFSADGRCVVSATAYQPPLPPDWVQPKTDPPEYATLVWDSYSGKELLRLPLSNCAITSVKYSPDGQRIAGVLASTGLDIVIWDANSGKERMRIPVKAIARSIAFSPDSKTIAAACTDGTVRTLDVRAGSQTCCFRGHDREATCVRYSADGIRLASGGEDRVVRMWDPHSPVLDVSLADHDKAVTSVDIDGNDTRIVSASDDGTIGIWDFQDGKRIQTLSGDNTRIEHVQFSPDATQIAIGSEDGTIRVWNARTGHLRWCLRGHNKKVYAVHFSPDGRWLESVSKDYTIRLWNLESGTSFCCYSGFSSWLVRVVFSPDGRRCLTSSDEISQPRYAATIWDLSTGKMLQRLPGGKNGVTDAAWSHRGVRVASGSYGGTVQVWNADTGEEEMCIPVEGRGMATYVEFSSNDERIYALTDRVIRTYDALTGRIIDEREGPYYAFSFSEMLVSGLRDFYATSFNSEVTTIERCATGETVAFYPEPLSHIAHVAGDPSMRRWAGGIERHLCIIVLEDE